MGASPRRPPRHACQHMHPPTDGNPLIQLPAAPPPALASRVHTVQLTRVGHAMCCAFGNVAGCTEGGGGALAGCRGVDLFCAACSCEVRNAANCNASGAISVHGLELGMHSAPAHSIMQVYRVFGNVASCMEGVAMQAVYSGRCWVAVGLRYKETEWGGHRRSRCMRCADFTLAQDAATTTINTAPAITRGRGQEPPIEREQR